MYSTSIGLVLTGFQALDQREQRYSEMKGKQQTIITKQPAKKVDGGGAPLIGTGLFKGINEKLKGLLMDDFDDKSGY